MPIQAWTLTSSSVTADVDKSWCYLFTQTAGIFEQVVHLVRLLSLLCNLRVLARKCKVWQNGDHDLWETVGQQVPPVLLETPADRLHLLEVIQEDQTGDKHRVG